MGIYIIGGAGWRVPKIKSFNYRIIEWRVCGGTVEREKIFHGKGEEGGSISTGSVRASTGGASNAVCRARLSRSIFRISDTHGGRIYCPPVPPRYFSRGRKREGRIDRFRLLVRLLFFNGPHIRTFGGQYIGVSANCIHLSSAFLAPSPRSVLFVLSRRETRSDSFEFSLVQRAVDLKLSRG